MQDKRVPKGAVQYDRSECEGVNLPKLDLVERTALL